MSEQHTVIEVECLEDGCDQLEDVTHLGHDRTDRQTEIVLDAHVEAARLHEEEAGHEFNVSVETGTPSEMEALYEDLTGERLVADGGTEQESAAIKRRPRLDGETPDWADDLIGHDRRGIEILDLVVTENSLGRTEVRIQTHHENAERQPIQDFGFSRKGLGWRVYTSDPPQVCERVLEYLEEEKPLLGGEDGE